MKSHLPQRPSARHGGRFLAAWFTAVALLGSAGSAVLSQQALLGTDGTVYSLQIGTEHELFRVGTGLGDRQLLALDLERNGNLERVLVPSTQDALEALLPRLAYLRDSDSTFVLWESQVNSLHSQLNLVRYQASSGFSNPIEISGRPFIRRLQTFVHPVIETDVDLSDPAERSEYALVHVSWLDSEGGSWYLPVIDLPDSEDLVLASPIAIHALLQLDEGQEAERFALAAMQGSDRRGVSMARLDRTTGTIERFSIFPVPGHLSELARALEEAVAAGDSGAPLQTHADAARATIVNIGRTLSPAMSAALGEEIDDRALAWHSPTGDLDLEALASDLRSHLINIGARLDAFGLTPDVSSESRIVTLPLQGAPLRPSMDVVLSHAETILAGEALSADVQLELSSDGRRLALFRLEGNALHYRLFLGDEWGQWVVLQRVSGAAALDLAGAHEFLAGLLDS